MRRARLLVLLAVALAMTLLAAACQPGEEPAAEPEEPETPDVADTPDDDVAEEPEEVEAPETFGEAPDLAELVEAGELPPVEERLPETPLVVEPWERIGVYGGTWPTAVVSSTDEWLRRTVGYDNLMRWDFEFTEAIPNIAERVDINEDGTEYVFHLRPGMRWSDGELFTAHDITFWYDDVQSHLELGGGPPAWMRTGDDDVPGEVEALDDHTVVFRFPGGGNGLLLFRLAAGDGHGVTTKPRHYLEQFHEDYNPDLDQLVADEGFDNWATMWEVKAGGDRQLHPDLPTLRPWVMQNDWGTAPQVAFDRNPYYWKVDPEGNQLPYIDRVVMDVVEDTQIIVFKAINGELGVHTRHIEEPANRPLIADYRESGGFEFIDTVATHATVGAIQLNQHHRDPVLAEIFSNKDFRAGVSHAIDRQEIIDVTLIGQGEPYQAAPRPESEFWDEEHATQFTEFDLDLANEYLDAAGLTERDAQGFRLRPDGERLTFSIDLGLGANLFNEVQLDALELTIPNWEAVGLDVSINALDRSLAEVRKEDMDHDAVIWCCGGAAGLDVYLSTQFIFPTSGGWSSYLPGYGYWWQDPEHERAIEPEPGSPVREQMELFKQVEATPDPEEREALMWEVFEITKEQFYTIGIAQPPNFFGVVRNDFHNVPREMPLSTTYLTPGPSNPEQFFIEE